MRIAEAVVQASVDFGLSGEVGFGAVLIGAVGLIAGLARHSRRRIAAARLAQKAALDASQMQPVVRT
jgi:hypothetical protein